MLHAHTTTVPGKSPGQRAFFQRLRGWPGHYGLRGLHWLRRHWKGSAVGLALLTPTLGASWILFDLDLRGEARSVTFSVRFNDAQTRFQRLAWLFKAEADHRAALVRLADNAARRYRIDTQLFRALIRQESAWRVDVVSSRGAAGLTQLMPETAREACGLSPEERFDAAKNLDCGARYFARQLERFQAVDLALAAYNAGPTRVAKLGRIPRIPETQNYVARIMADWDGGQNG